MSVYRITLPGAPDANAVKYRGNQQQFNMDVSAWMAQTKQLVENFARTNSAPVWQPFLASAFTTNTIVTGTTTGTDLSDFVASLVAAMTARGLLSPTASRSGSS